MPRTESRPSRRRAANMWCAAVALGWFALTTTAQQQAVIGAPVARDTFTPAGMTFIPAGPYFAGTTKKEVDQMMKDFRIDKSERERFWKMINRELVKERRRSVKVGALYADVYETTVYQYHFYRNATGAAAPSLDRPHPMCWREGRAPGLTSNYFVDEVKSWPDFAKRIGTREKSSKPWPGTRIRNLLKPEVRDALDDVRGGGEVTEPFKDAIMGDLNRLIATADFYDDNYWRGLSLPKEASKLLAKKIPTLSAKQVARLNRILLDGHFGSIVEPGQSPDFLLCPVTGLTPVQAKRCAEWLGKRLPTEFEWEKIARGAADRQRPTRRYPWGDMFGKAEKGFCNWALMWLDPKLNPQQRPPSLTPVGRFPKSVSPYGAHDMIGNALEMTQDPWGRHPNGESGVPFSPPPDSARVVVKGGAYGEQFTQNMRIAWRVPMKVGEAFDAIGFRCVKDPVIGQRVLARAAEEQFNALRGVAKIAKETAAMERTRYLEGHDSPPVITSYEWIGFATIESHSFAGARSLDTASDRVKRKKELGKVFLGVIHTDAAFTNPPLPPGTYAMTYQRGFPNADLMNANVASRLDPSAAVKKANAKAKKAPAPKPAGKKADDKSGKKDEKSKKATKSKKTPKKKSAKADKKKASDKKAAPVPAKPDEKGKGQEKPGDEKPKTNPGAAPLPSLPQPVKKTVVLPYSQVPRIIFVNASGQPVAAIESPAIDYIKGASATSITAMKPEGADPAVLVHLAMKKKFEKNRFLTIDFQLKSSKPGFAEGWTKSR